MELWDNEGKCLENDDEILEYCRKTTKGFHVKCVACGSEMVYVESTVGFSYPSGAWGEVSLKCHECDQEAEIWTP